MLDEFSGRFFTSGRKARRCERSRLYPKATMLALHRHCRRHIRCVSIDVLVFKMSVSMGWLQRCEVHGSAPCLHTWQHANAHVYTHVYTHAHTHAYAPVCAPAYVRIPTHVYADV